MDTLDHDHQLRAALKVYLSERLMDGDLLVDEFHLAFGAVRADVALVNGHLEGFEIKAGRDTLARLPHQVVAYSKVFEFSWVVTTKAHLSSVRHMVPREWGLLVANVNASVSTLKPVRKARRNGKRDGNHLVRLLWRNELVAKLDSLGLGKGLKSKPKIALFPTLASALPLDELADYVRHCLKTRADWRAGAGQRGCGGSSHLGATE